jgi:hypothetical protein
MLSAAGCGVHNRCRSNRSPFLSSYFALVSHTLCSNCWTCGGTCFSVGLLSSSPSMCTAHVSDNRQLTQLPTFTWGYITTFVFPVLQCKMVRLKRQVLETPFIFFSQFIGAMNLGVFADINKYTSWEIPQYYPLSTANSELKTMQSQKHS